MKATQLYRKHNGENCATSFAPGEVNGRVSAAERTNFTELSVWRSNSPDNNPVDYAVWGTLQQDVYKVPIVGLEEVCAVSKNCEKFTKTFFEGFKVIDVDKAKKPVTSACYDEHHVCAVFDARLRRCREIDPPA